MHKEKKNVYSYTLFFIYLPDFFFFILFIYISIKNWKEMSWIIFYFILYSFYLYITVSKPRFNIHSGLKNRKPISIFPFLIDKWLFYKKKKNC